MIRPALIERLRKYFPYLKRGAFLIDRNGNYITDKNGRRICGG